jgi:hypothetical protein
MSSRGTLEGQQVFQRKLQNLAGNREGRYRVSTKFFVKSRWNYRITERRCSRWHSSAALQPSRKSVSRYSKEIANASEFAERLTLSAFPRNETRQKIVAS